ncbi:MAG: LemA family protein [Burkholderiaceae bacterium]
MSLPRTLWWWVGAALLLFWAVGGYNRLVRMRNAIQQQFAALDVRLLRRNEGVAEVAGALPALVEPGLVEALQAALGHSRAARERARKSPCDELAITNLGVAETVLSDVRARLAGALSDQAEAVAGSTLAGLLDQLAQAETALGFARDEFNRAAAEYNHAVLQFPTRLLAAVFGFGVGATLPALA